MSVLHRLSSALLACLVAVATLLPTVPASAQAGSLGDYDQALVDLINEWRASQGLDILAPYFGLNDDALGWSTWMAGGSTNCTSGAGTRWGHSQLSTSRPSNPPGTHPTVWPFN